MGAGEGLAELQIVLLSRDLICSISCLMRAVF